MTSEIKVDTISEQTSANGVTIDGLTIKDGNIIGDVALAGTTPTFTIGDAGAEDAALIFDGNAVDYYIALDDSADDLVIGTGSTIGSNAKMVINSDGKILIGDVASHTADLFQIETPASGGGHGIQIRRNDANTDQQIGTISFGNNTDTDLAQILVRTDNDSNSGDSGALTFKTQPTGGASTERMRIDSSGFVGIANDSPSDFNAQARNLVIGNSSGNSGMTFRCGTSDAGSIFFADGTSGSAEAEGFIQYSHGSDNFMIFGTANTERMRIHSNGVASFNNGIALGVGTANTASNVLDDYEEGTWTATLAGTGSSSGQGYDNRTMQYTKIGRMVYLTGTLDMNALGTLGGDFLKITGLPFNPDASNSNNYQPINTHHINVSATETGAHFSWVVFGSNAFMYIFENKAGGAAQVPTSGDYEAGTVVGISGAYITAS